jgi:hypothetical protein
MSQLHELAGSILLTCIIPLEPGKSWILRDPKELSNTIHTNMFQASKR